MHEHCAIWKLYGFTANYYLFAVQMKLRIWHHLNFAVNEKLHWVEKNMIDGWASNSILAVFLYLNSTATQRNFRARKVSYNSSAVAGHENLTLTHQALQSATMGLYCDYGPVLRIFNTFKKNRVIKVNWA